VTAAQWALNVALLVWVVARNVGTRPVRRTTFLTPVLVVAVAAAFFLRDLPTGAGDLRLELVGVVAGVALGLLAGALAPVRPGHAPGTLVVTAGAAFVAVWVLVVAGRVAFAEWATHGGARAVGEFSLRHDITGAAAWTGTFVLLALTMVLTRTAVTAAWARRTYHGGGQAAAELSARPLAAGHNEVGEPACA
jgi:hypothetical protein